MDDYDKSIVVKQLTNSHAVICRGETELLVCANRTGPVEPVDFSEDELALLHTIKTRLRAS